MAERAVRIWKGMTPGSVTTHQGACNFCPWKGPVRKPGTVKGIYVSNQIARSMAIADAFAHEDAEHSEEEA